MCVLHLIDRFHLKWNNTVHVLLFISILRFLFFFFLTKLSLREHWYVQIILPVFSTPPTLLYLHELLLSQMWLICILHTFPFGRFHLILNEVTSILAPPTVQDGECEGKEGGWEGKQEREGWEGSLEGDREGTLLHAFIQKDFNIIFTAYAFALYLSVIQSSRVQVGQIINSYVWIPFMQKHLLSLWKINSHHRFYLSTIWIWWNSLLYILISALISK